MQQSPNIVDSDQFTFDADVIEASNHQLILVDFWAEWCGPCRSLGPILEQLIEEYDGALKLVKINADEQQNLCAHYGVRSLPTVYFFKDGAVVEQFMGLQQEQDIRTLIDKHVASKVDPALELAISEYESGEHEKAISTLRQLLESDSENDQIKQLLAGWLSTEGRWDETRTVINSLSQDAKETPEYRAFVARLDFNESASDGPSDDVLFEAIRIDENDLESRCQLADRLVIQQRYADAMDQLLEVIQRDRTFKDDAPRESMIRIFHMLGGSGELVSRYRSLLARTLN